MLLVSRLSQRTPPQAWVDNAKEAREAEEAQNVALQAAKAASSAAETALVAARQAYLDAVTASHGARRLLNDPPPKV